MFCNGKWAYFLKLFLIFAWISGGVAFALPTYIDEILIDNKGYKKDRMGPVMFYHKKHAQDYKVNCWECHHDYQDGKNVWSPWFTKDIHKCNSCHNPVKSQDKAMKLQRSYHVNCKTCHKERDIYKGEPRAYRKCVKCHLKKDAVKK